MQQSESSPNVLRSRLGDLEENCIKALGLKAQFLFGCRRAELCGKWAILNEDISFERFEDHDVVVFYLKTAKRSGKSRPIALPKNHSWVQEIADQFKDRKGKVFDYSTKTLYRAAVECYAGLQYNIEKYFDFNKKVWVSSHDRGAATHFSRHIRAKELVTRYKFSPIQLTHYMGWKLGRSLGGSSMMDKYIDLQWHDYVSKFFIEHNKVV